MDIKKILIAGLAAMGFLAIAACTEGDPSAAPPPADQSDPMAPPPTQPVD